MRHHRLALAFLVLVILLGSAGVVRVAAPGRFPAEGGPVSFTTLYRASNRTPAVEVAVRGPRSWRTTVSIEAPEGMSHHGQIVVDVVDADGSPLDEADRVDVLPIDCPGFVRGPAGDYQVEVGPCALQAVRHDGRVLARGPVSTAVVEDEDPAYVSLQVPDQRYGEIGIDVEPDPGGMRVVDVWPGTPAEEVGLLPGDMIVAVEGRPVAGMESDRFAEEVSGEEGTSVEVTLALGQDTGVSERTVHITREYLEGRVQG